MSNVKAMTFILRVLNQNNANSSNKFTLYYKKQPIAILGEYPTLGAAYITQIQATNISVDSTTTGSDFVLATSGHDCLIPSEVYIVMQDTSGINYCPVFINNWPSKLGLSTDTKEGSPAVQLTNVPVPFTGL